MGWVPVTVRLDVPATFETADILRIPGDWGEGAGSRCRVDREFAPVAVRPPRAMRGREEFQTGKRRLVIVRLWVDPDFIDELQRMPHVQHVTHDAPVEPFEERRTLSLTSARVDCGADEVETTVADVARVLGVTRLREAGLTGRGIVVGVVDGGITAHGRPMRFGGLEAIPQFPGVGDVVGGWPDDWGSTAEGWGQHGNMIAFDVQAMAPDAELWDIRIYEPDAPFPSLVSNAVQGYRRAIDSFLAHGVPHVLVNSWGVYDSSNGPSYAFDPNSDIALHVEEAIDAGMLVLFAAGNCGDGCRFTSGSPCGFGNRGPGCSILGPNGHPDVMTVGAATVHGEWCGYTSQGPAALPPNDPDKPDFCSISQFEGYFPNESGLRSFDGGTSAATGIAAGVVALLKQARPDLTQEDCRRVLRDTARPIHTRAASEGCGAGVIDAVRAFGAL